MGIKVELEKIQKDFKGNLSIYANDLKGNVISINANEEVEAASCIKVFILLEYYKQIYEGKKNTKDILKYYTNDYLEEGSGILKLLENDIEMTSLNMAIFMIAISDNIATNILIDYLGFENINNTIKELGFLKTKLLSKQIDFTKYTEIGITTAKEYGRCYEMLQKGEFISRNVSKQVIGLLAKQTEHDMLTREFAKVQFNKYTTNKNKVNWIASKCGELDGNEENKRTILCENDGGIISTNFGEYVISIFANRFQTPFSYYKNEAIKVGSKISKILFDQYIKNNGKF